MIYERTRFAYLCKETNWFRLKIIWFAEFSMNRIELDQLERGRIQVVRLGELKWDF